MRNQKLNIDATKFDIRVLWTGLKEEHVSADAGVVEGYPLDPPDDLPGWFLVDFGIESTKDADRYWTLWTRAKTKVRAKRKARAKRQEVAAPTTASVSAAVAPAGDAPMPPNRTPARTPTERKARPPKKPRKSRVAARPNQAPPEPESPQGDVETTTPTN